MNPIWGWGPKNMADYGLTLFGRANYRLHLGTISTGCITCSLRNLKGIHGYEDMAKSIQKAGVTPIRFRKNQSGDVVSAYGILRVK